MLKIKRVKEIEDELKQAVEMGDYLRAVELCKESKKEVEIFRMFNCVKALDNEVQHIFHTVKEKLSNSLLEVTRNFSPVAYGKILAVLLSILFYIPLFLYMMIINTKLSSVLIFILLF